MKRFMTAAAAVAALALSACGESAERTGENMDSSIEQATQGEEKLGDGPLERAGESIDEATGRERTDNPADAVSDAADGNASTNP